MHFLTQPGPGDYEIPGTIGRLPKYYCGPKKLTTTGFSTHVGPSSPPAHPRPVVAPPPEEPENE